MRWNLTTKPSLQLKLCPAYVGRALANSYIDPEADVMKDLQQAIALDPNYLDSYYYHAASPWRQMI